MGVFGVASRRRVLNHYSPRSLCWHFCWHNTIPKIRAVASSVSAFHSAGIRRRGFRRVHPPVPAPLVAPRNLAPAGEDDSRVFAPAVTRLLMLRCPAARAHAGAFRQERSCSLGAEVKRAVPLLQNETQNMNTTENLISTGCPATAPQPTNQIVKPIKFPAQPQEWKIVSLRECPTPETMQQCETPDQAAAYWKTHIEIILTSIPNVNVWWFSSSTPVGASKVTIWCPLARWIQSSVIPGRFFDWRLWRVRRQSSSHTIYVLRHINCVM